VQQCLTLLEHDSELTAITLEGLRAEDESATATPVWNGVDCCLYFGGSTCAASSRVVVDQMKYSGSAPQDSWTVARLIKNTRKSGNNSVLSRLADAFHGLLISA